MITSKHGMNLCFSWFLKRALVIIVFFIVGLCPFSANAFDILLGTEETGTFSHFTGRILCRVINSYSDDINCKTVPAPDDVDNLTWGVEPPVVEPEANVVEGEDEEGGEDYQDGGKYFSEQLLEKLVEAGGPREQ